MTGLSSWKNLELKIPDFQGGRSNMFMQDSSAPISPNLSGAAGPQTPQKIPEHRRSRGARTQRVAAAAANVVPVLRGPNFA